MTWSLSINLSNLCDRYFYWSNAQIMDQLKAIWLLVSLKILWQSFISSAETSFSCLTCLLLVSEAVELLVPFSSCSYVFLCQCFMHLFDINVSYGWSVSMKTVPHSLVLSLRACYGVLRFVMESGAKGCEVNLSLRSIDLPMNV